MTLAKDMAALRSRPIGDQAEARARRGGYRRHPIARSNAHYGAPLVDVRTLGIAGENYYFSERNPPYWGRIEGAVPDLKLRQSVAAMLQRVNARLKPMGLELFVFDAWG